MENGLDKNQKRIFSVGRVAVFIGWILIIFPLLFILAGMLSIGASSSKGYFSFSWISINVPAFAAIILAAIILIILGRQIKKLRNSKRNLLILSGISVAIIIATIIMDGASILTLLFAGALIYFLMGLYSANKITG